VRVAAHPAVARRQRGEVDGAQRVGGGGARGDPIRAQELLAREVRRLAPLVADAEERGGLAEEDRTQGGVRVGEVEQGQVAQRRNLEQPLPGR
jgi:hypothetical protein